MAEPRSAVTETRQAGLARLAHWLDDRLGLAEVGPQAALLILLFSLALVLNLWTMSQGWGNPLLDMHDFRQTQTAITVDSMLRGGPLLAYEIPVFGPPWALPFEFPLFQWLVAGLVRLTGAPIDQAGRLISAAFFYLSLGPAYALLGALGLRRSHRLVFLILLLTSPLYLFWSRTFMIESCAVFLGLTFLAALAAFLREAKPGALALAILASSLAASVKVTTYFGIGLAAGLLILQHAWPARRRWGAWDKAWRPLALAMTAAAVPLLVNQLWTAYADAVKLHNPIGATLTSSALLEHWILGPLSLRTSAELWRTILVRMLPDVLGYPYLLLLMLPMLLYAALRQPRLARLSLLSALLFLAPILVFANLHLIHNYYQYAVGLFLLASAGFLIVAFLRTEGLAGWTGVLLLVLFASIGLVRYRAVWLPVQRQDTRQGPIMETALTARDLTEADEIVLIAGFAWDPAFAYYADRRALMLPVWLEWDGPEFQRAFAHLERERTGALMVCRAERDAQGEVGGWRSDLGMSSRPAASTELCDLYLPEGDDGVTAGWP